MVDPASLVGLVGLITLLSACREAYDILCETKEIGDRSQKWLGAVELQKFLFREWSRKLGIDPLQEQESLTQNETLYTKLLSTLTATRARMIWNQLGITLKVLSDIDDLQKQYHLSLPPDSIVIPAASQSSASQAIPLSALLQSLTTTKKRIVDKMKSTQQSLSAAKKAKWVFRDGKKMEKLCQDLKDANSALVMLMAPAEQAALRRNYESLIKNVLTGVRLKIEYGNDTARFIFDDQESDTYLLEALNEDRELSRSMAPQIQVQNMLPCPPLGPLQARGATDTANPYEDYVSRHRLLIALERTRKIVLNKKLASSEARWLAQLIDETETEAPEDILVELKRQKQLSDVDFSIANQELVSLLHASSQPPSSDSLSSSFMSLRCKGYVLVAYDEDDGTKTIPRQAVCFCFAVPSPIPPGTNVPPPVPQFKTLSEMLQRRGSCPPLEGRFNIAKGILRKYYNFLRTGWLHKGLRSNNIVFFPSSQQDKENFDPHIMGFEYSRSIASPQTSEKEGMDVVFDRYRHPSYRNERNESTYRLSFDLYSLGIILIELAYWKSVAELENFPTPDAIKNGELSVLEYKRLRIQVGTKYANVVQGLLKGQVGYDLNPVPSLVDVSQSFSENLLKKLDECQV